MNTLTPLIPNLLTIAGSDSGGGAGIQADLKTFSALGGYGASVITALTAQNTHGVQAVCPVDPGFVGAQLDAVFSDIRIDAVKIGMLANAQVIRVVRDKLAQYQPRHVILDTVMVAKGGHALLDTDAIDALLELMPAADLITPNLPEAAALLRESPASDEAGMIQQGQALRAAGARAVLIKGGHLGGPDSPDWLIEASGTVRFGGTRIETRATHGTGCTLSSAITALRPQRTDMAGAINDAKLYLTRALEHADRLAVGSGIGPVHHFHGWW